jgi:hypothetical protein
MIVNANTPPALRSASTTTYVSGSLPLSLLESDSDNVNPSRNRIVQSSLHAGVFEMKDACYWMKKSPCLAKKKLTAGRGL